MPLAPISEEQLNIISCLENNNVVVDSVAGSGKTTTNLYIAKTYCDQKILLLTYNSRLKEETREKVRDNEIDNIEVHSYHSFSVKYFYNKSYTDKELNMVVNHNDNEVNHNDNIITKDSKYEYDIIIIDEAQDLTPLYYNVVHLIYKKNMNANAKLCVMGDIHQSIFVFNNADERYIQKANIMFQWNNLPWVECKLSISFRITHNMSNFINKVVLKYDRMKSNKMMDDLKVRYVHCNVYSDGINLVYDELKWYLNIGINPMDIFILAPSVISKSGGNTPVIKLENKIKENLPQIHIHIPNDDNHEMNKELMVGKLVISTFHQTKGLERKCVIVFNFDDSYFRYYCRKENQLKCPNTIYVAVTRASQYLSVIHDKKNGFLPFIDISKLELYCDIISTSNEKCSKNMNDKMKKQLYSPTSLINHVNFYTIDQCIHMVDSISSNIQLLSSNIQSMVQLIDTVNKRKEFVADIIGVAIPIIFQKQLNNKSDLIDIIRLTIESDYLEKIRNSRANKKLALCKEMDQVLIYIDSIISKKIEKMTFNDILHVATIWISYQSGYIYRVTQIQNYEWSNKIKIDTYLQNMNELNITQTSKFEYKLSCDHSYYIPLHDKEIIKLIGYADCYDKRNNILYEFKCCISLKDIHILQLVIMSYIFQNDIQYKIKKCTIGDYVRFKISKGIYKGSITAGYIISKNIKSYNIQSNDKKIYRNVIEKDLIMVYNESLKKYYGKILKRSILTKYILYNVVSKEKIEINTKYTNLRKIIDKLIEKKIQDNVTLSDDEFIKTKIIM